MPEIEIEYLSGNNGIEVRINGVRFPEYLEQKFMKLWYEGVELQQQAKAKFREFEEAVEDAKKEIVKIT